MPNVVGQNWEELERGWGERPDGYSLHLSLDDCQKFRAEFWSQQREHYGNTVPDEYTRERGEPVTVEVDDQTFELLKACAEDEHGDFQHGLWGPGRYIATVEGKRVATISKDQLLRTHPLLNRARESVHQDFEGIYRKAPAEVADGERIPYAVHLDQVAELLAECGARVEVIAAGYLHDNIEDLSDWTKARIESEYGSEVADLVDWVTQQDKSLSWEERNERYTERLRNAPDEALMISAADKINNIESLNECLAAGFRVDQIVKRGWAENSAKFHELQELFIGRIPEPLLERYREALSVFDRFHAH